MKQYHILKDFPGSQSGNDFQRFTAGTIAGLSDALARIVVAEGWAEPVEAEEAPPVPDIQVTVRGVLTAEEIEAREKKVIKPTETKPAKPVKAKK